MKDDQGTCSGDRSPAGPPSGELAGAVTGRPCPLEVIAAEPAGHIDHLADEVETRHGAGFHRLGRQGGGIDAAQGNFGEIVRACVTTLSNYFRTTMTLTRLKITR